MPHPDISTLPWRLNVGMMILNSSGCIWMGRRMGMWDHPWQFPQGGIDEGESPEQAMWRELNEEVGIKSAIILDTYPNPLSYSLPTQVAMELGFQGQKQTWFLLLYQGSDDAICVNEEFCQWAWVPWCDLHEVIQTMVTPFKRNVYMTLIEGPFQSKAMQTVTFF